MVCLLLYTCVTRLSTRHWAKRFPILFGTAGRVQRVSSMIREDRKFGVAVVSSKQELRARLRSGPWPLCTAFQFGDLVFANTSRQDRENQEFSVIHGDQLLEVLQVDAMTPQKLYTTLEWLIAGGGTFLDIVVPVLEPAESHHCDLCQAQLCATDHTVS